MAGPRRRAPRVETAVSPFPPIDPSARQITPTDVAQFIRLDQCERYLRLRLTQSAHGSRFMADYDVVPQSIPPLLTRSGAEFERKVERAVAARHTIINCASGAQPRKHLPDNDRVVTCIRMLAPGAVVLLFQTRIHVQVAEWRMRGDIDILRLERDWDGTLHVLVVDMKSSTSAKVEHRLQVAFYHEMLSALFTQAGIAYADITLGILYRGPAKDDPNRRAELTHHDIERAAARRYFGMPDAFLELVADPESYLGAVRDLVTDPRSTAARVAQAEFATLPYHLSFKCDGCIFNEFCMKWSAERDDLSLLPHLSPNEKTALVTAGVSTMRTLSTIKGFRPAKATGGGTAPAMPGDLVATRGQRELVRRLSTTWPIGPRLDELVHRARRYRKWQGDALDALTYIPSKGYGSLPYADAGHNPNLVRVYIDVQNDYLQDRLYLLGALVVASEGGAEPPERRRTIVHLTDGPPDSDAREEDLLLRWINETLRAIVELAAPDAQGRPRAPIHLIFFDTLERRLLLNGLARHAGRISAATPLYDLLTQLAAFDSPVVSYLNEEIRELKNFPMVCQSLQSVAAILKFDWNKGQPYRQIFRARLFDSQRKLPQTDDAESESWTWYTARARFNTQIPLEYAYAAWGELEAPPAGERDDFAAYRAATAPLLQGFQARRLEATEWIAKDFRGNQQTQKSSFELPDLAAFTDTARSLAHALDEFVTIERHVELAGWKRLRLAPPERRVLSGDTLIVRYEEADQEPGMATQNREHLRREQLSAEYAAAFRATHPDSAQIKLSKEQRQEVAWSHAGMRFRLRLDVTGVDADLDEVLALATLRAGDRVVVYTRTTCDTRLPPDQRILFTPTPKQMLYGQRADIVQIVVQRDRHGRAVSGYVEVKMVDAFGGRDGRGFTFGSKGAPFIARECYTLDLDPNDWYGSFCAKVTEGLVAGQRNTLYERLSGAPATSVNWPGAAANGQARFLAGLDALHVAGALHSFEPSKRTYIGKQGAAPVLLVQGPPGTGKSYATGFAIFARLQGALAADLDARILVSCKTHAATDVLLKNIADVQGTLRRLRTSHPTIFSRYFDPQLLDLPLYRFQPPGASPEGTTALLKEGARPKAQPRAYAAIMQQRHCVLAATPAGIYRVCKDQWGNAIFGHDFCDCLVLDEASQMNLPEAAMAALSLKPDGQLIVVGDHRQMPPIVKHDWATEPRRTFQAYRSYESLFLSLLALKPPMIKFAESFRLHADMAEFLRREVYAQDGIRYHSVQHEVLPTTRQRDSFVASVLSPAHTIVVVVHDETGSQLENPFERGLMTPVLEALANPRSYNLDPRHGLGVVVPHRAQRAAFQEAVPCLSVVDPQTGAITISAVDTVERFQGDERVAILVSGTESDAQYLLASSEFLLDPRRLTVALSRAKQKMVLVASESVFALFSADETVFANAQLWKNLLRRTCTVKLWEGTRDGHHVVVWGSTPMPTTPNGK